MASQAFSSTPSKTILQQRQLAPAKSLCPVKLAPAPLPSCSYCHSLYNDFKSDGCNDDNYVSIALAYLALSLHVAYTLQSHHVDRYEYCHRNNYSTYHNNEHFVSDCMYSHRRTWLA